MLYTSTIEFLSTKTPRSGHPVSFRNSGLAYQFVPRVVCLWLGLVLAGSSFAAPALVDSINPMIGASTSTEYGEGKTFPGAATPFGLVQLSPDTITGGDNGPGYSWEHKTIEGF